MNQPNPASSVRLRESATVSGYGLRYAWRTARVWWYSAWLRTLARFSRTFFGSFWLGLSNLLSVSLLSIVYGTVLKVQNPWDYAIYLGFGLTIWGFISQSIVTGCNLFSTRRDQLVNNALPALFYCLEEWAFQIQTFAQAFAIVIAVAAIIKPIIVVHALTAMWLPLLNLLLFCFWALGSMALLGARFKDMEQLTPILLQLVFLLSPILYRKDSLGPLSVLADLNPLYRVLESVRTALIDGRVNGWNEIANLAINVIVIASLMRLLKLFRHRLPLWA